MYTVYIDVSLQALGLGYNCHQHYLESSGSDKLELAYQLLSRKLLLHLRYFHCWTFVHCLAVFIFGDFYEFFR